MKSTFTSFRMSGLFTSEMLILRPPNANIRISVAAGAHACTRSSPFPGLQVSDCGVLWSGCGKTRQGVRSVCAPLLTPHCSSSGSRLGGLHKMSATRSGDPRVQYISDTIRAIPDFPHKGIMFRDVTTLLLDHKAFKDTIDIFVERYRDQKIDVIVGIEARGFIFGPPIALAIGAKFVPMRKPRKLPGPVIRQEYSLEYGTDCIEMHVGAIEKNERVVLIDDLIATGGTLGAAIKLLDQVGAEIVECGCLIELVDLKGREKLSGKPLYILVEYEGE